MGSETLKVGSGDQVHHVTCTRRWALRLGHVRYLEVQCLECLLDKLAHPKRAVVPDCDDKLPEVDLSTSILLCGAESGGWGEWGLRGVMGEGRAEATGKGDVVLGSEET